MNPTSLSPTICPTSPPDVWQTSQIQNLQTWVPYLLCKLDSSTVFLTTPSDSLSLQRSGPGTLQSPLTPHPSFSPSTDLVFCIFPGSDTSPLTLCPQSPTISHLGYYHGRLPGLPASPLTPITYCQHRSPSNPVKTLEPVIPPLTALWWLFIPPNVKWRLWRQTRLYRIQLSVPSPTSPSPFSPSLGLLRPPDQWGSLTTGAASCRAFELAAPSA